MNNIFRNNRVVLTVWNGNIDRSACLFTFKLPNCLCIHLQRTVWLNNGMPMKRYEHVTFPEVLDISRYVYPRCDDRLRKSAVRPTCLSELDADLGNRRLVGGKRCVAATSSSKRFLAQSFFSSLYGVACCASLK